MNVKKRTSPNVQRVSVATGTPYEVLVGPGLLSELPALVNEEDVAIIADAAVAALYGNELLSALERAGKRAQLLTFPSGEASKSLSTYGRLLEELAAQPLPRGGAIIGLGGGVACDLAGFVAATYMRGVALYQAPTSLLAMVDASVGGKSGVDLSAGKNLAGAFWQPHAVVADTLTLRTLPEREFRRGSVELYKHALLADESLLTEWRAGWSQDLPQERLAGVIARSVAVKARVVEADEREAGVRAHLNLGHTLAHALETASEHRMEHGDAVAYGLVYAAFLARKRGFSDQTPAVLELFNWVLPAPLPIFPFHELHDLMSRDKKAQPGAIAFVLLEDVGRPEVVSDLSYAELERAWRELLKVVA